MVYLRRMTDEKPKVLLVEDDPFMTSLLAEGLAREGFAAELAKNGEDAVQRFSEIKPQAILLDIILPGKSGLEALAEIRALPGGADVPVIILSNVEEAGYVAEAERLHAAAYLVKANIQVPDIVAKVKEVLGTAKR